MQSSKMFGLLIVAVEGLISVEPGVVTMGPDESNDATCPASAMVGGGRKDILSLKVQRLVSCPKSGPPSKSQPIELWCSTHVLYRGNLGTGALRTGTNDADR
jgi:hypothetical protein